MTKGTYKIYKKNKKVRIQLLAIPHLNTILYITIQSFQNHLNNSW